MTTIIGLNIVYSGVWRDLTHILAGSSGGGYVWWGKRNPPLLRRRVYEACV